MTDELTIAKSLVDDMVRHCLEERPNEACGLLASKDGVVVSILAMSNAARSPVRYALDSKEQFRAYKALAERQWELGGVFHSHTHTDPVPSPTDVRLASEDVPYVIVSLASEPPSIRAFRIRKQRWEDEHGDVVEVPVEITD